MIDINEVREDIDQISEEIAYLTTTCKHPKRLAILEIDLEDLLMLLDDLIYESERHDYE